MSVRFIHAADLHLGSPLRGLEAASPDMAERLGRASEASVGRIIDYAIERAVDFVVVSGDLYDQEARSVRANQFLADAFGRLDDIPVYVVHGNHDPLGKGAELLDLPDNVHVFGAGEVESILYPHAEEPEAELLGRSYGTMHEGENFIEAYEPTRGDLPTIGLLHTGMQPDGHQYVPCSASDLDRQDVDYWALGHIHQPMAISGAPAAYPGIPQPRHPGEPVVGGCLDVDVSVGRNPEMVFVPTAPILWNTRAIDIAEFDREDQTIANLTDLEEELVHRGRALTSQAPNAHIDFDIPVASDSWGIDGCVVRWTLTGRGDVSTMLGASSEEVRYLTEQVRTALVDEDPFVWTETIRNRTEPPLPDRDTLVEEDALVAEFVDLVEDVRADEEARTALREVAGGAWQYVEDPDREEVRDTRIALTDERLDELLEMATETAISHLARGS